MSAETMTLRDLAAADIYILSADRITQSFNRVWGEAVKPVWPEGYGHPASGGRIQYSTEGAAIWDWIYLRSPYSPFDWNVWYVGWGIRFPAISDWWSDATPALPARIYCFVCLGSDEDKRQLPPVPSTVVQTLGETWSMSLSAGNQLIRAPPMCEFDADPEKLAVEMIQWIKDGVSQLKGVATEIARSAPQGPGAQP